MLLSPHEQERLLLHVAADLAQKRRDRGLKLNYPEAVALISAWVLEGARDGRSVAELMTDGQHVLDPRRRHGRRAGDDRRRCRSRRPSRTARSSSPCTGRSRDPRASTSSPDEPVVDRPASRVELRRRQHGRPAGAGRLALPLRGGQPGAGVRPRRRAGACGWRCPPARRCGSSRASSAPSSSSRWAARRPCRGCGSVDGGPRTSWIIDRAPLRRAVRPDRRRPGPARRHRPAHRGHRGPLPRPAGRRRGRCSAAARSSASRWARPAPPAARAPRTW